MHSFTCNPHKQHALHGLIFILLRYTKWSYYKMDWLGAWTCFDSIKISDLINCVCAILGRDNCRIDLARTDSYITLKWKGCIFEL